MTMAQSDHGVRVLECLSDWWINDTDPLLPQDPAVTAEALDPGVKKARVFTFPLSLATGQTSSTNQRCPSNICDLILEV